MPSGIWHRSEYEKLTTYDGETWEQNPAVFLCHQKDGCLCGGWLLTHDPRELLALRLHRQDVAPETFEYNSDVEVFASGKEAHDHGVRDLDQPSREAWRNMEGLKRLRIRET
ncbi:hypothetical protein Salmuc_03447 [Salipiger mucosus DSM 16094]|uniref:Uncharacterized protein n=1 Tax=Salipiger mucosus DSM 16094 TaxID=1123237 RepID=S9Q9T2_9RHOB|nr:hypothetical protein Salmuc_03447 [Salipiger mucosus DSM 16094]